MKVKDKKVELEYIDKEPTKNELVHSFMNYIATSNNSLKMNVFTQKNMDSQSMHLHDFFKRDIENYLDENVDDYYYINNYWNILDVDNVTIPTSYNFKEKYHHMTIDLFNHVFKNFEKEFSNKTLTVEIPDKYLNNYGDFVNNKLYYQEFYEDDLFHLINYYFRGILYHKDNNFSPKSIFGNTEFRKKMWLDGNQLNIDLSSLLVAPVDGEREFYLVGTRNRYIDYRRLRNGLHQIIDFFVVSELIEIYFKLNESKHTQLEDDRKKELIDIKEQFLGIIKGRRVPVSQINHKGAKKSAEQLGLTHVFLPLDEEAIPAGTPFSIKIDLLNDSKTLNAYTIIPPIKEYKVMRDYLGHNNQYPGLTTKSEPHLLDKDYMRASLDKDFYKILVDNYDWEEKEELEVTLQLIDKHPRLMNDLIKLGRETEQDD